MSQPAFGLNLNRIVEAMFGPTRGTTGVSLDEQVTTMFGRGPGAVDQPVNAGTCKACGAKVQGIVRYQVDQSAMSVDPATGKVSGTAALQGAVYHHECNGPVTAPAS